MEDPGPGPSLGLAETELLDPEAHADEAWCRQRRDELIAFAESLSGGIAGGKSKARVQYSTVAKVYEVALKFHRAAAEERRARRDRDHDRWLVRECHLLAGRGVGRPS